MSKKFVYVSATKAGQVTVKDSPIFGKVEPPASERKGIAVLEVAADGQVSFSRVVELENHVGWVAVHPTNGCVYAAGGGGVLALRVGADGGLVPNGQPACAIGNPAYIEVSADGGWILAANYSAGTITSLPILADGTVGPAADSCHHAPLPGTGLALHKELADRQEASHPHQIRLDPHGGGWALVNDLGLDCVFVYAFDAATGGLRGAANSARHLKLPKGAGPRHLDFHPSGKWVFVLCELDGMVVTCSWDSEKGQLTAVSSTQSLPPEVELTRAHHSGAAQILCARDGHTVYASTRTDNMIVSFAVDPASGVLSRTAAVSCLGVCPRNFHIDEEVAPKRLRVCNQDTQTIASFEIQADGSLAEPPALAALEGVCPSNITLPLLPPTS